MNTGIDDLQRQHFGDVGDARNALAGELALSPAMVVFEPSGEQAARGFAASADDSKKKLARVRLSFSAW